MRLLALTALAATSLSAHATNELSEASLSYTQSFNTLAASGTSGTLPVGWVFVETGSNADSSYGVSDGGSTAGNTYSFGAAAASERALGSLLSGSLVPAFGVSFTNQAGRAITSLAIAYTGEQWRQGSTGRTDRLDFQFSTDATSLSTGTWTDVDALDFSSVLTSGTVGKLDGNSNKQALSGSITGLTLASGATLWLRWNDFNASGSDDGLAVDDFSLNATLAPVPEPSSYAMLLAGLASAGLLAQRRRRSGPGYRR